jgi:hypothetical protein
VNRGYLARNDPCVPIMCSPTTAPHGTVWGSHASQACIYGIPEPIRHLHWMKAKWRTLPRVQECTKGKQSKPRFIRHCGHLANAHYSTNPGLLVEQNLSDDVAIDDTVRGQSPVFDATGTTFEMSVVKLWNREARTIFNSTGSRESASSFSNTF